MRLVTFIILIWFAALLWFSSDGGMSVPDVLILGYAWPALLIAWIIAYARRHRRAQKMGAAGLVSLALLLSGGIAYWTGTAIYLRLLASRSALERYAAAAGQRGLDSKQPVRAGLFLVRETETLEGGTVRLITAECMFDDCGLVFSSGQPPVIGEDSYDHLLGKWWHWRRSW